ncbi:MAG: hypothetical protein GX163_08855 [Bacteroidetes bacterium]|nr:hypothetical protein [Bacteroidota bacterium]
MKNTFTKTPKIWAALYILILIGINYLLFFGRNFESLRCPYFQKILPSFYSHISNFSISFMFVLIIGYLWILQGMAFKKIIIMAAVMIVLNFLYELFLPLLNTKDIVDAYFGMAGSLLATILLLPIAIFGTKLKSGKSD